MVFVIGGIAAVALAALLVWLRRRLVRVEISGTSMSPTFRPGDRVLARRVPPSRIRTGDIVVMEGPPVTAEYVKSLVERWQPPYAVVVRDEPVVSPQPADRRWVIKRVAAVPGEPVPPSVPRDGGADRVPPGSLVVLGDNPDHSVDSRHHGYVPLDQVLGKVVGPPRVRR